jgi:hypothetical protein
MKKLLILLCLSLSLLSYAPVFAFEVTQYQFIWHMTEAGKAALDIEKTPEGTRLVLKSTQRIMGGSLKLTASEAERIGAVFAEVDVYYEQMKDKTSDTQKVMADTYEITFSQSSSGFWVILTPPDSILGFGRISLDREGVKAVTTPLLEASERVKFFAERILF